MNQVSATEFFKQDLKPIIKKVSRSFYLSLKILPKKIRNTITLAYLLARAADTIADTQIYDSIKRKKWLEFVKKEIDQPYHQSSKLWNEFQNDQTGNTDIPQEKALLDFLPHLTGVLPHYKNPDQAHIRNVVVHLISGMEKNISYFHSSSEIISFKSKSEINEYCYDAAGVVGKFWTQILFQYYQKKIKANSEQMEKLGIDFGNGLQMINILKDMRGDLKNHRGYLPKDFLNQHQINTEELINPNSKTNKIILDNYLPENIEKLSSGQKYLTKLPKTPIGLRLAVILPLWIGLETLYQLKLNANFLEENSVTKIKRSKVKFLMLKSMFYLWSNRLLNNHFNKMKKLILN
jgi:farnesyl-diphosphate farnesyltransferase